MEGSHIHFIFSESFGRVGGHFCFVISIFKVLSGGAWGRSSQRGLGGRAPMLMDSSKIFLAYTENYGTPPFGLAVWLVFLVIANSTYRVFVGSSYNDYNYLYVFVNKYPYVILCIYLIGGAFFS